MLVRASLSDTCTASNLATCSVNGTASRFSVPAIAWSMSVVSTVSAVSLPAVWSVSNCTLSRYFMLETEAGERGAYGGRPVVTLDADPVLGDGRDVVGDEGRPHVLGRVEQLDRKSTRLNSSHLVISYAVFCL